MLFGFVCFPYFAVAFCIVMWPVTVLHLFLCECECERARPSVSFMVDSYVRVFDMFEHFAAMFVCPLCGHVRVCAEFCAFALFCSCICAFSEAHE